MKKIRNTENYILDWAIKILGYAIVLIIVSVIFKKTINIDSSSYGLWYLISSIVIYILNKLVKPILVFLTLPLTGLTMGLFYPFINVIILYITDFLLKFHFELKGILMVLIVAISIFIIDFILTKVLDKLISEGDE